LLQLRRKFPAGASPTFGPPCMGMAN